MIFKKVRNIVNCVDEEAVVLFQDKLKQIFLDENKGYKEKEI